MPYGAVIRQDQAPAPYRACHCGRLHDKWFPQGTGNSGRRTDHHRERCNQTCAQPVTPQIWHPMAGESFGVRYQKFLQTGNAARKCRHCYYSRVTGDSVSTHDQTGLNVQRQGVPPLLHKSQKPILILAPRSGPHYSLWYDTLMPLQRGRRSSRSTPGPSSAS
jgi:hypothetical protein